MGKIGNMVNWTKTLNVYFKTCKSSNICRVIMFISCNSVVKSLL